MSVMAIYPQLACGGNSPLQFYFLLCNSSRDELHVSSDVGLRLPRLPAITGNRNIRNVMTREDVLKIEESNLRKKQRALLKVDCRRVPDLRVPV